MITAPNRAPTWQPSELELKHSNAAKLCARLNLKTFAELHRWSVTEREAYWRLAAEELGILFTQAPTTFLNWNPELGNSEYLTNARFNIAESCFLAEPNAIALIEQSETGTVRTLTFADLKQQSLCVASAYLARGLKASDPIAIDMPMTLEAVIAYLGALWIGAPVVSIADSFAPAEIATRLRITDAKLIVTQDVIARGGKTLPMFGKVAEAGNVPALVVRTSAASIALRAGDSEWNDFIAHSAPLPDAKKFAGGGMDWINILFSSGTTGDPKAIPWNQSTPIKAAADARYHHNVQPGDRLCWPTNLGWMMGPWLLFAAFLNRSSVALYTGSPLEAGFASFVGRHKVTLLGVVPSLVKTWRQNKAFEGQDLRALKVFSSTGECSNADDMGYLMNVAGSPRPIIEYCGGTEIGGAYLTSSVMEPNIPSTFSTPTLGLDLVILNEAGAPTDNGEVFLVPPSLGLSAQLLVPEAKPLGPTGDSEHFQKYFAETPKGPHGETLRRHGDQLNRLSNGYYQALGRVDDTMNLGGIKVSSAELERVLLESGLVVDCAAIAVTPIGGGPSQLIVYSVTGEIKSSAAAQNGPNPAESPAPPVRLIDRLQKVIRDKLNPLFKIHEVREVQLLPRTASNKVMRRVLRDEYLKARDAT